MLRTLLLAVLMVLSAVDALAVNLPLVRYLEKDHRLVFYYGDESQLEDGNTWQVQPSSYDYITSSSADRSKPWEYLPWYEFRSEIETVEFHKTFSECRMVDTEYLCYGLTALKKATGLWNIRFNPPGDEKSSMAHMFEGCTSLTDVEMHSNESYFFVTWVDNFSFMFSGCTSLETIKLDMWDKGGESKNYSNSLYSMFSGCTSLKSITFGEVGDLLENTSNMALFCEDCKSLASIDLTIDLDVNKKESLYSNKGIDLTRAFAGCSRLQSFNFGNLCLYATSLAGTFSGCRVLENVDTGLLHIAEGASLSGMFTDNCALENVDLSKVEIDYGVGSMGSMEGMFSGCEKLSGFKFSKDMLSHGATDLRNLFNGCKKLVAVDLSGFNTANVTDMSAMFKGCAVLRSATLTGFDTSNVKSMSEMFSGCLLLDGLNLTDFTTSAVNDMNSMFYECQRLSSLDLTGFDTGNVQDMSAMFYDALQLTSLDLSSFNTAKVRNMSQMFFDCWHIKELTLGKGFTTAAVTNMHQMFAACAGITSLNLSGFNTANVTDMSQMFTGCDKMAAFDLSAFDTGKVTNMNNMFSDCEALVSLDLTGFNTASVKDMRYMFNRCKALATIYVSPGFTTDALDENNRTDPEDGSKPFVFYGCTALKGAVPFDAGKLDVSMANYATGYFTVPYKLGGTPHPLTVAADGTLTCGRLVLDGDSEATRNFTAYEPFTATEGAEYSRMLPYATYWGSVCLPFAFNTTDCSLHTTSTEVAGPLTGTFTFYDISSLNDAKDVLTLTRVEGAVEAGRPLLYHTDTNLDQLMTIKTPNAPTAVVTAPVDGQVKSGIYLTGTFTDCQLPDEAYALASNRFRAVSDYQKDGHEVWSRGLYAYMMPSETAAALAATISFDDSEATAIGSAATIDPSDPAALLNAAANGTAEIYDLDGRRLSSLQKGVNVVKLGTVTKKIVLR